MAKIVKEAPQRIYRAPKRRPGVHSKNRPPAKPYRGRGASAPFFFISFSDTPPSKRGGGG